MMVFVFAITTTVVAFASRQLAHFSMGFLMRSSPEYRAGLRAMLEACEEQDNRGS